MHRTISMVLEAQSASIKQFWENLLPAQNSELPCMHEWRAGKYIPSSFKDVHAQAHCAAAYLMRRGLKKGDHVGILPLPGIRYHVLNIALQYLGAVNVTIPVDYSTEDITRLARKYQFSLLFVDTAAQAHAHDEFKNLKDQLLALVIGEDDVETLEADKVVTFECVVTLGKSAWREQANELKAMKAAVGLQDLYAILIEPERKFTPIKMERWVQMVDKAEASMMNAQVRSLLSTLAPDRLIWRAYGFAAVTKRISWWIRQDQDLRGAGYKDLKPQMILLNPEGLRQLFDLLPEMLDIPEKGRKAIIAAMEVIRKRDDSKAAGKKDPILNRLKYKTSNRKLYRRIKTKLGGKIVEFVCDKGLVDSEARVLFEESSIKITQPG